MRFTKISLVAALVTASLTTMAEAKRGAGFSGHYEFMEFVAEFNAPADLTGGATLSLCHLIDKNHALYVPLWYESQGYVLAENRCVTDSYLSLTPQAFADAQAAGIIPVDLPAEPSIGFLRKLPPYLFGLALILGFISFIRKKLGGRRQSPVAGGIPAHVQRVLDVACHAARSDGVVGDQEVEMISAVVHRVTDVRIDARQVRAVAANCDRNLQQQDFTRFAQGLEAPQKELLMKVALLVIGADGIMDKGEQRFLNGLAEGLSISQSRFQSLMVEMG